MSSSHPSRFVLVCLLVSALGGGCGFPTEPEPSSDILVSSHGLKGDKDKNKDLCIKQVGTTAPDDYGQPCGCGGTIQCNGECSFPFPDDYGEPCGCGGTIQCGGMCSSPLPIDYGEPCGCGGTVECGGGCSVPFPQDYGEACGCGGTIQCGGGCSLPFPIDYGEACGCGGTIQCGGGCSSPEPNTPPDSECALCGGSYQCDGSCSVTTCGTCICDDGDACNGVEQCDPVGACLAGTPPVVDDGDACTADACDASVGVTHTPISANDGNPCTVDSCDPLLGAIHSPAPQGTVCGDGLVCDGAGQCLTAPPANQPPTVSLGEDIVITGEFATVCLYADATDDGKPGPLTYDWAVVKPAEVVTTPIVILGSSNCLREGDIPGDPSLAEINLSGAGIYRVRVTVGDGAASVVDEATVTLTGF